MGFEAMLLPGSLKTLAGVGQSGCRTVIPGVMGPLWLPSMEGRDRIPGTERSYRIGPDRSQKSMARIRLSSLHLTPRVTPKSLSCKAMPGYTPTVSKPNTTYKNLNLPNIQ